MLKMFYIPESFNTNISKNENTNSKGDFFSKKKMVLNVRFKDSDVQK